MRARRHEQRVEKIVVAIERLVAGLKLDLDDVLAGAISSARKHDVIVDHAKAGRPASDDHALQGGGARREVEHDGATADGHPESNGDAAVNRLGRGAGIWKVRS